MSSGIIPQPTADDLARFPEEFWEMLVTDYSEFSRDARRIWIRRAVAAERGRDELLHQYHEAISLANDKRDQCDKMVAEKCNAERAHDALRAEVERLKMEIVGHQKANDLLLKGMESQADLMDGMKQKLRASK